MKATVRPSAPKSAPDPAAQIRAAANLLLGKRRMIVSHSYMTPQERAETFTPESPAVIITVWPAVGVVEISTAKE